MPGLHSKLGPSNAHRWRPCPGSIEESEGLPDEAGEEAHQGTVFHEFAAEVVEFGVDPFSYVGRELLCEDGKRRPFTETMAARILPGLDFIRAIEAKPGVQTFVEVRVDLSDWFGEGMFGTSDVILVDVEGRKVTIFDWKWGAGVPVSPDWNDQAISYFLGAWSTIVEELFEGIEPAAIGVDVVIEQPRAPGGGGLWRTDAATLLAEGRQIRRDSAAALSPGAPRVPGSKQCQFCPAAKHNTCKARAEFALDLAGLQFDDLDESFELGTALLGRRAFTPEQRSALLLNRKVIERMIADLHDQAIQDARDGNPVPGMKRVYGRAAARKWIDDAKIEPILEAEFEEEAWTKKLRSPAQIEEKVGKRNYRERFSRHVSEGEAAPVLVPLSDARDEIPSVDAMFDEAMEEDLI